MPRTIRAVMVGCGAMSRGWLTAAKKIPGLEISGLVDINETAAQNRRDEFGFDKAFAGNDLRGMLKATKPDAVFDCTVPVAHMGVTLEAFKHGCHVLGEKPISDTIENAKRMVRAAVKSKRLYAVIQNRRYIDGSRRLRAAIQSGKAGEITELHSDFYVGARFAGFRQTMPHVLVIDMAIHTFDTARFVSGCDPVSVYCREWNPKGSWHERDASALAIFEMSNGVVYTYRGSWDADGLHTSWQANWRAVCTDGTFTWDGEGNIAGEHAGKSDGPFRPLKPIKLPVHKPLQRTAHEGNLADFIHALRTGSTPLTICTDNIKTFAMSMCAAESSETGRTVKIKV